MDERVERLAGPVRTDFQRGDLDHPVSGRVGAGRFEIETAEQAIVGRVKCGILGISGATLSAAPLLSMFA